MADNLDNIKDIVLEFAQRYADALGQGAQQEFGSGRLSNSYRGVAKFEQSKFSIEVFGEAYGLYQDSGVNGRLSPGLSEYSFGSGRGPKGGLTEGIRTWAVSKGIPEQAVFAIVRKIYLYGLKPRPFIDDSINPVTRDFIKALEDAGQKDVEQYFDTMTKIEVK